MNIRMLFFPFSLVVAFALVLFSIQPEFTLIQQNRANLAQKEVDFSTIDQKVQNMQALTNDLDQHKDNESLVLHYLPESRYDDRIVDAINFLVSQTGLSLTSIKIANGNESGVSQMPAAPLATNLINTDTSGDTIPATSAPVNQLKNTSVSVLVVGSYENIRSLTNTFEHLDRFQHFASMRINHLPTVPTADGSSDNTPSLLAASIEMEFSYLPKQKMSGYADVSVLNKNHFSFDPLAKLKQYTALATVPSLEANANGSSNPFLR